MKRRSRQRSRTLVRMRPHHLIFLMSGMGLALAALLGLAILLLGQTGH